MKLEVKINDNNKEPLVTIETSKITDEISKLINYINSVKIDLLIGNYGDQLEVIKEDDIVKIIAQDKKVYVITEKKTLTVKLALYEMEQRLNHFFVRISNSEIINAKKIKNIDMSFRGKICLTLSNNECSYCSRRYVKKIKEILGL
ncbi:LytTR family transcriptional regulator [Tuanshanicoccus lijuaniae]|uniref:LytTR family DNA-binding domain-containing protein n=1 Tax=Aerococcaceae bacterium zg-1292 TaxID=2774330 RepID=UPI001934C27F|nr:LytTR family transcriptional regulator [Aerococcaceae bacterium zg-1292]QQA36316.1 LytTR family transcriptional regulator [Aerococcaceae bacterium zg-1292]